MPDAKAQRGTLAEVREHLFETLRGLRDPDKPLDIARAKAVVNTAQAITATAIAELKAIDALGREGHAGEFFGVPEERKALPRGAEEVRARARGMPQVADPLCKAKAEPAGR